MTLNILSLIIAALWALAAVKLLSMFGEQIKGRAIPFGVAFGLILLISGTAIGSFAAGIGASEWAILGSLAIACGGVTLGFLIPALSVQAELRKQRGS